MAEEHNLEAFRELLDTPSISDEDIAEMAGVPVEAVSEYRAQTSNMGASEDEEDLVDAFDSAANPVVVQLIELCRDRKHVLRTRQKIPLKRQRTRRGGGIKSAHIQISDYKGRMVPVVIQAAAAAEMLDTLQVVDRTNSAIVYPRPRSAASTEQD